MNKYKFGVVVAALPHDPTELFEVDGVLGASKRAGIARVTFVIDADSAEIAAFRACAGLMDVGITPLRYDQDLVSIAEIADRIDKDRETVRLWTTGKRRGGFPGAHTQLGTSRVWHWADVYAWLTTVEVAWNGNGDGEPLPARVVTIHNGLLAERRESGSRDWVPTYGAIHQRVAPHQQAINVVFKRSAGQWESISRGRQAA